MAVERGIGVCLLSATPIHEYVKVARLADEVGLHSIWMAEGYHFFRDVGEPRSATTVAAAVALATKRIKVGLGIVPAHTRHPALLAMEAVSLSELSNGRFILGLGAAKAAAMHMGYTSETHKPVPAHRDAINIVRAIFKGDAFAYQGKTFTFDAPARRKDEPTPNVPIAIGATGPLMLKLGGALADIVLLPTFTTPAFVRYARGEMAKGAAETHRNVSDIPIGATLPFSIDEDSGAAHDAIRKLVAVYITNKVTNIKNDTLMSAAGMGAEEAEPIANAATEKGIEAATAMVTNEMIDKVAIAGNPDEVNGKLQALLREGLTLPLMYQVIGPDREKAIRLVAETVQPVFMRA
jgi:5,10-methylenetetrahydromethanopterin reductase